MERCFWVRQLDDVDNRNMERCFWVRQLYDVGGRIMERSLFGETVV
jgi:hypothetical protein